MAKIIFKTLALVLLLFITNCRKKENFIIVEVIEYDVLINNFSNSFVWFDNIESSKRQQFFDLLINAAKSGKFEVKDINSQVISKNEIEQLLNLNIGDTANIEQLQLNSKNINGIRFREQWKINTKTAMISKEVIAMAPIYFHKHILFNDTLNRVYPLFWIYPNEEKGKKNILQLTDKIAFDVIIDNSNHLVRSTYGNKLDFYFKNIELAQRKEIISVIKEVALSNKTKSYDFFFNELGAEDLKNTFYRSINISVPDTLNPGLTVDTTYLEEVVHSEIQRLKFIEQWSINTENLQFTKHVIAVSPAYMVYDNFGEFRGFKSMFWLMFDDKEKHNFKFE